MNKLAMMLMVIVGILHWGDDIAVRQFLILAGILYILCELEDLRNE